MTTFGLGLSHYPSQHQNQPSFGTRKGKIDDPRILAARKAWKAQLDAEKAEEEEKADRLAKEREIQEAQAEAERRAKEQPPQDTLSLSRTQTASSATKSGKAKQSTADALAEQERMENLAAALEKQKLEQKKLQNDKKVLALAKKALAYIFKTHDGNTATSKFKVPFNRLYSQIQPDGSRKEGTLYDLVGCMEGAETEGIRRKHHIATIESMEDLHAKLEKHKDDELSEPTAQKLHEARHWMFHRIGENPNKLLVFDHPVNLDGEPVEPRATRQRPQHYQHPEGVYDPSECSTMSNMTLS